MKKKFGAFLREENSLRELAMTGAGKPAFDPAAIRQWQRKLNAVAMVSNQSVALILQITPDSIGVILKSDTKGLANIEHFLDSGFYCNTDLGNIGLLVANKTASESADDAPAGMSSITTCFGLPIQWPDEALFGVVCVMNYPGKTLKPAYRNILSDLREAIEQELILLRSQELNPQTPELELDAPAPAVTRPATQEPIFVNPSNQTPQPPEPAAPAPAVTQPAKPEPVLASPPNQTPQSPETDELTSIYSRKKIEDVLKHEFDRAKRYFKTFSVTMIDLSGFQKINETFGRDVGDDLLKAFAQSVSAKIRETDFWGRWGGDEFILLCPYADTVETQQMFTRIKPLVLRDMKTTEAFTDFYFGVSQHEPDDLTYQAIVNRAEENMLQYKEMLKRKAFDTPDDQNAGIR